MSKSLFFVVLFATLASAQTLVWHDEFNQPDGSAPDPSKWSYKIGKTNQWNELEYYTNRPKNSYISGGNLVIAAFKEQYNGKGYTSARLQTKNNFSQLYGRFEARIKIDSGAGLWPTFWMLGDDIDTVGWPACGEMDIFEYVSPQPNIEHGSIHGPWPPNHKYSRNTRYTISRPLSANWHIYAIDWTPGKIQYFMDGILFKTATPGNVPAGGWVFDHPFYILLNLAIGDWGGQPSPTETWPQKMLVDYVRVYQ